MDKLADSPVWSNFYFLPEINSKPAKISSRNLILQHLSNISSDLHAARIGLFRTETLSAIALSMLF
jgi:hypothetical protein